MFPQALVSCAAYLVKSVPVRPMRQAIIFMRWLSWLVSGLRDVTIEFVENPSITLLKTLYSIEMSTCSQVSFFFTRGSVYIIED